MNPRGVLLGRARALRNSLFGRGRSKRAKSRRGPFFSLAAVTVAAWLTYEGFAALFPALARAGATPAELRAGLALALDLTLVGLLLFDLESAVSTLILDRDLDLLRVAPLPPRAILGIKLMDALPRTAVPLVVVALPALLAFSGTHSASGSAWLMAPIALALLWVIPLGVGTALTLALLSRIAARRVRESLGLISIAAFTALWIFNLVVVPRIAGEEGEPLTRVRGMLAAAGPALALTPGGWVAALFGGAGAGDLARLGLALAGAAVASAALAAYAAGRHLSTVLAAARTPVARSRVRRVRPRAAARRVPLVVAVMRRDRLLFVRDWTMLADVLTGALLWTLVPLLALPLRPVQSPTLVRAMLLVLSIGLGYEIGARAFPLERRGAHWMRLAPVRPLSWAVARLVSAGSLALALVAVAGAGLGLAARLGPGDWLEALAVVVPALALSIAIGLWTGAVFGDPNWTSPRAVLTLGGRLVAVALVVAQAAGWITLTIVAESFSGPAAWTLTWLHGIVAAGLCAIATTAVARSIGRAGYCH